MFPRVVLGIALRFQKACIQFGASRCIVNDALFDVSQPDAFYPRCGAIQIMRLFAIYLHERAAVFQHLFLGRHLAQKIGDADFDAAVAAHVQLVAGVHAHHAKILDGRFGAVARTT